MSVKPEGLLGDIKTTNSFYQNLNFNTYLYMLYYQSSIRFLVMGGATSKPTDVTPRVKKQRHWLVLMSPAHNLDDLMFCFIGK